VRVAFHEARGRYEYRRIHVVLARDGTKVSEKVIRRLMKEENLVVVGPKKRKYSAYKGEISPAVPNLIRRDFHAAAPNAKWLTDITEFHIPAGRVYLSTIIDCFDGMVVSWSIGTSPNADLVTFDRSLFLFLGVSGFARTVPIMERAVVSYSLTHSLSAFLDGYPNSRLTAAESRPDRLHTLFQCVHGHPPVSSESRFLSAPPCGDFILSGYTVLTTLLAYGLHNFVSYPYTFGLAYSRSAQNH